MIVSTASQSRLQQAPAWLDTAAYPFEHRWLEVAPGRRMHYVDVGAGEPVLFVHGTPTWSFEWRHAIAALSRTHRCIAVDHLGFGLSDRPWEFDYTPESHARMLRTFIDELGLDDITLVVHDFGGPIGLPTALDWPGRVRRLVIINSWMWSFQDDPAMRRAARVVGGPLGHFLYRRANVSLRVVLPGAFADRSKLTPAIHGQYLAPFADTESRGRVLWPLARALLRSSPYYESLWRRREGLRDTPALIIWGTRDPALKPYLLTRWRSVLPNAHAVELPVGHWPHEEASADVVAALHRFLAVA